MFALPALMFATTASAHLNFRVLERRSTACAALLTAARLTGDPDRRARGELRALTAARRAGADSRRAERDLARLRDVDRAFDDDDVLASAFARGGDAIARFFAHAEQATQVLNAQAAVILNQSDASFNGRILRFTNAYQYDHTGMHVGGLGVVVGCSYLGLNLVDVLTGALGVGHLLGMAVATAVGAYDGAARLLHSIYRGLERIEDDARTFVDDDRADAQWFLDFDAPEHFVLALARPGLAWSRAFMLADYLETLPGVIRFSSKRSHRVSVDVIFRRIDGEPRMSAFVRARPARRVPARGPAWLPFASPQVR